MIVAIVVLTIACVLVFVICVLCARGIVPRNRVAGIRIASVLASDESWRIGHRAAILPTGVAAAVTVVIAVVAAVMPQLQSYAAVAGVAVVLLGVGWAAVAASRAAR